MRSTPSTWSSGTAPCATAARIVRDHAQAEELAQEAFTRAFDRWSSVATHPAPAAWVLRVVSNLAFDELRRRRRIDTRGSTEPVTESSDDATTTSIIVRDALEELPSKQRQAIALRYFGGCDDAEIAAALNVRPGTVKTHLKRGLERLRRELGPDVAFPSEPTS